MHRMLKLFFCKKPKTKVKQRPETKWYLWTHLSAQLLYNTIHGLCHSRIITYAVQMEQAIWFSVYSDMCSTCIFQQCNTWTFTVCFIQQWYLGNIWLINFEDDVSFFLHCTSLSLVTLTLTEPLLALLFQTIVVSLERTQARVCSYWSSH